MDCFIPAKVEKKELRKNLSAVFYGQDIKLFGGKWSFVTALFAMRLLITNSACLLIDIRFWNA